MKKIFFTNHYKEGEMREIVFSLVPDEFDLIMAGIEESREEYMQMVGKVDYLFAGHTAMVDAAVLDTGKNLKMVQRFGVGLDSVDMEAMKQRGIPLYVNRGVNARSVAELVVLLTLGMLRQVPRVAVKLRENVWEGPGISGITRRELCGQTFGIVGFGMIGKLVAEMLKPFGAKLIYTDPHRATREDEVKYGISYRELDDLLKEADIISLHCMMDDKNRGFMNKQAFAKMKDGARFINTSRGGLVNDADLADAVLSGKLSSAALDAYEIEPLPSDSILLTLPDNVILTPHIGGVTRESFQRIISEAFYNIKKFDEGDLDAIADRRVV
jgi:phosphoglycerate dehydrogenase-like enzyme